VTCSLCEEKARGECPRCRAPVCGFHGPWKEGFACRRCEDAWDAAKKQRRLAILPVTLMAAGLGAVLSAAAMFLLMRQADLGLGAGGALVMLAVPILIAVVAKRRADRAMRRRFLATPPPA